MRAMIRGAAIVAIAMGAAGGCETLKNLADGGRADEPADEKKGEGGAAKGGDAKSGADGAGAEAAKVESDARDAAGAVALLAELCGRSKAGEHDWVGERVQLPLRGIHSINDRDEDQHVHQNDNEEVEDFQYTSYCRMLPAAGTKLRDFAVTEAASSGVIDFGPMAHRVEFDLTSEPPKLVALNAQVPPTPVPERPAKPRAYELGPPPKGFTDREPEGSRDLRRKTIAFLEANPACIEDYTTRDVSVIRFNVIREVGEDGVGKVRVDPFQLVRASVLGCLRTQIPGAAALADGPATSAIIEVLIPVSADEFPDAPTVKMKK